MCLAPSSQCLALHIVGTRQVFSSGSYYQGDGWSLIISKNCRLHSKSKPTLGISVTSPSAWMNSVIWSVGFELALFMKCTESVYHSASKRWEQCFHATTPDSRKRTGQRDRLPKSRGVFSPVPQKLRPLCLPRRALPSKCFILVWVSVFLSRWGSDGWLPK